MASEKRSRAQPNARIWSLPRTVAAAALVVAAVQTVLLFTANSGVLHGTLFDPDCYMHLQRAYHMMSEGVWHALSDPRINAPAGYSIHWTALFDILLVAGATPLQFLGLNAHNALYVWGSIISPLLLVAGLAAFAWGVRPWVGGAAFLWLTVLLFTQPQFSGSFLVGRPDHHSLVMMLLMVQLAWLYAFLDGRATLRLGLAAGVIAGLQMCTSVEALLTVLMAALVLILAWVFYHRDGLRQLVVYLAGCTATMTAWTAWQGGLFVPAYDRISIVHIAALGSGAIGFSVLVLADRLIGAGKLARLCACGLAAGLAAVFTVSLFPDFFRGPWPHLDAAVIVWHSTISELQPLLPSDAHHAFEFLAQFTGPVLSLPLVLHQLFRGERKPFLLVSLTGFVLFGIVALAQMRWSAEVQAVMLLPWTLTTQRIMRSEFALVIGKFSVPLRSFGLAAALLLQTTPSVFARGAAAGAMPGPAGERCPWTNAIKALPTDRSQAIVLTDLWHGPEILWRTPFRVIGAPYEIPAALIDTERFSSGDEMRAREIVSRRHVALVLICNQGASGRFVAELGRGIHPDWLMPVAMPDVLPTFRLYRVKAPAK